MNLVLNASEARGRPERRHHPPHRAGDPGPAAIRSAFQGQALEPGPYVFLEVADDGPGMAPECSPGSSIPSSPPSSPGGAWGSRRVLGVVRAHRGGIQVHSQPGRGTQFKLVLPAAADADAEAVELPRTRLPGGHRQLPGRRHRAGGGRRGAIRAIAVQALQQLGFDTLEAAGRPGGAPGLLKQPGPDPAHPHGPHHAAHGRRGGLPGTAPHGAC